MPDSQRLGRIWQLIASPVLARLRSVMTCGLTPQKLALTLCLGSALGTMPLLWGTSLLSILLAHRFRLNQVALQSLNYLLYPLQLALLVPFFKLGTWLFPWRPSLPSHMLTTLFRNPDPALLNLLGWMTFKSLAAWLITAIPAALFAYVLLMAIDTRKKQTSGE